MCVSVNKLKPQELFDKQQSPVLQKVDMAFHLIMQLASLTLIHWIVIYPVDSGIQILNKRG